MAKHKIGSTQKPAMRYVILTALVLGWGTSVSWGQQQTALAAQRGARAALAGSRATPADRSAAPRQGNSESAASASAGKRDPFKLPEVATGKGGPSADGYTESLPPGGVLPPGKRGLIISQLKLEGVVRQNTSNIMTALVVDQRKLAYFLHVDDSVYNGVVSKITPDSVYFKENVLDSKGRVATREVVKRLGAAPGEGR